MQKEKIKNEIVRIEKELRIIRSQKEDELNPLISEIENKKLELKKAVEDKYKERISLLNAEMHELNKGLDKFLIDEAKDIWYPAGTIVYLWEWQGLWSDKKPAKTNKMGVVCIYDGSQKIASRGSWSSPKIGDVIVIHLKKDGSQGLQFSLMSAYGRFKDFSDMWLADGDTPKDNIETRKIKLEVED